MNANHSSVYISLKPNTAPKSTGKCINLFNGILTLSMKTVNYGCMQSMNSQSNNTKEVGTVCKSLDPDLVMHACNANNWEVEIGGSEVQGHSWLCSKFA